MTTWSAKSGPALLACHAGQREKVPGAGADGQGAAVVACPCGAGQGAWLCCGAGCCSCCGQGAGCCWLVVCAPGCCEAVRGFALRFGFGFDSGSVSTAAVFLS